MDVLVEAVFIIILFKNKFFIEKLEKAYNFPFFKKLQMLVLAKHHKYINRKKCKILKRYCSTILADQRQTESNIHDDFIELIALDETGDENHATLNHIL